MKSSLIDRGAHGIGARRLGEPELYQRAAGELDAVVHTADREHAEADDDKGDRRDGGVLPVLDEVVLGIVKNAQH